MQARRCRRSRYPAARTFSGLCNGEDQATRTEWRGRDQRLTTLNLLMTKSLLAILFSSKKASPGDRRARSGVGAARLELRSVSKRCNLRTSSGFIRYLSFSPRSYFRFWWATELAQSLVDARRPSQTPTFLGCALFSRLR
jgi:hypothetical protein